MPAKYWRFEGGLQEVPEPEPPAPCQQIMGNWNCFPNIPPPWMYQNYAPWQGFPGWPSPPAYMPGPIYINGLQTPPPQYEAISPPPPGVDGNLPPAPPKNEKKDGPKKKDKKTNPWAPPKMPEGCNYMYDHSHTMLHIFGKTHPVWEEKYKDTPMRFKMFKVSVDFTVKKVIERVLQKEGVACKGWAATEAVELGGGKWVKGSTIEFDSDKSDGRLKDMSWSIKRGDRLPPVWLVIHKV